MSDRIAIPANVALRAGAPEATTLEQVFDAWKKRGLEPREVTAEDFVQRVSIEHNTLDGTITYHREKADGLQTMALLWDAIRLLARHELFSQARPVLSSGEAAIALVLKGNKIEAIHDPPNDPLILVGLLIADACKIMDEVEDEQFDSLESLGKIMRFELG